MRVQQHQQHHPDDQDETSDPGQDTQANRVPQPYAALANARAHGFVVASASEAEIQSAWRNIRGVRSVPFGHLLVIASINDCGRERRLWVARGALASSIMQPTLLGRAIERAVQSELRDVTCGALILLERHGQLVAVPYIYQRYSASPSRALALTALSWCCAALMSAALMLVQHGQYSSRRPRRARRRTPQLLIPSSQRTIA